MTTRQRAFVMLFAAWATAACAGGRRLQAQEYAVTRRVFSFFDNQLDIDVLANSAGQLQVIRGEAGRVDVAAHATEGVASFGLATDRGNTLRLTALGAKEAEYVVVVPEQANVRVRLPGHRGWSDANRYGTARFRWDAVPDAPELDYSIPLPTIENKYYVVTTRGEAPVRVRLLGRSHIRSVEVRLQGTEFEVASSRPLTHTPGAADLVDIDAGSEDVDLVVQVPSYTRRFELRLEGDIMFTIEGGEAHDRCTPSVNQKTAAGAMRVLYRPAAGLRCVQ